MFAITRLVGISCSFALLLAAGAAVTGQDKKEEKKKGGFGPKSYAQIVDAAAEFLKMNQAEDGTWSKQANPGVTAVALTGLLRTGKISPLDPAAEKAIKFILSQVDEKEGHIAAPLDGGKGFQKNYVTTVNLQALCATGAERKKYDGVIKNAVAYLKKEPWDETTDKKPTDPWYGGVGYGPGTRPDLSNTHYMLDALHTAGGIAKDDPVYKKVVVFVSRVQNFKSENNDQPWAGAINDGSFIYLLGAPKVKEGMKEPPADTPRPGYGSMTYAGLKSLADCGISKEDPRFKKAWEWVTKNYSVDINPGFAPGNGPKGYFYYLATMANCLDTLGVDEVIDAQGAKHNWRAEITTALGNRQNKDGSFSNTIPQWMESNPDLCTGYALIALNFAKAKTAP